MARQRPNKKEGGPDGLSLLMQSVWSAEGISMREQYLLCSM
ncbi:MAG: hypothetical protein RX318_11945 [bacterium]|jgi:hypothetical protein|nr:hypothetical protein [bacterium]